MSLRRSGLVVSLLALTTALVTAPAGAQVEPGLIVTPASGPVGTTVTVTNDPADPNGKCGGPGSSGHALNLSLDDPAGNNEIVSTVQFAEESGAATGDWMGTFTVPAGLAPGDVIHVGAFCSFNLLGLLPGSVGYRSTVFTVTAAPTNGGGTTATTRPGTTTTTRRGTTAGATAIPQGGRTPVATPLVIQPRFTG